MTDLLGPANAANTVTARPADTRTFGASDTWVRDQSAPGANDGTAWTAATFNGLLAQIRNLIRGFNIAVDNTNDSMMLQAVQAAGATYANDTGSTGGQLVVNVNKPGFALTAGTRIKIKVANTVPGASTVQLSNGATSFGTINITRRDGSALQPFDLVAGQIADLDYDGTEFQIEPFLAGHTGDVSWALAGSAQTGKVPLNGLTIGSLTSGATGYAGPLAAALYSFLWSNFSNTLCPVTGGRGANAAADFAANKPIQLPDWQCKTVVGVDAMAGAAATNRLTSVPVTAGAAATPGSTLGEALHTLSTGEMPSHNHAITDPGHTHTYQEYNASLLLAGSPGPLPEANSTQNTGSSTTGITINNNGGGGAHNNTQLSVTAVPFVRM